MELAEQASPSPVDGGQWARPAPTQTGWDLSGALQDPDSPHLIGDEGDDLIEDCLHLRGKGHRRAGSDRLHLDGHRTGGQDAESLSHIHHEVDAHVTGHRIAYRRLELIRRSVHSLEATALDGGRRPPPSLGANQDQSVELQVLDALGHRHRPVVEILHSHRRAEVHGGQALDEHAPDVQITLIELADAADQHPSRRPSSLSRRRRSRC